VIPLEAQGERLGALYLDATKDNDAIKPSDREHLRGLANLIGVQLGALFEPRRDREVERHDLTLARRIQQRFLPQAPPTLSGYALVDTYAAARTIGGDHYDFLVLTDGRHALVIADVSGKALSGALYMARLGMILREAARRTRRASELLDDVNAVLYNELEAGMFVTMLVVVLEPRSGQLEIAAAGHPPPLLRAADGSVRTLEVQPGPPLGAMSEPTYVASRHVLEAGQCLLMYTDGLDEAHDADGNLFGAERVRASFARAEDARGAITGLREELARFVGTTAQSDDLTLLAVQRMP
jgi:sigma-B regulation protein RsbU (phosphoserine phosphatase)